MIKPIFYVFGRRNNPPPLTKEEALDAALCAFDESLSLIKESLNDESLTTAKKLDQIRPALFDLEEALQDIAAIDPKKAEELQDSHGSELIAKLEELNDRYKETYRAHATLSPSAA